MKEYLKQVYNKSEKEYFKLLSKWLKNNEKKFIITANPETLTMAETDEEISKMLLDKNNSIVPDGIAVKSSGDRKNSWSRYSRIFIKDSE